MQLLNVLALVFVAIVALSSGPVPVDALVADRAQVARHVHAHDAIARRKRSDSSSDSTTARCKPRPSSLVPTSTPSATSTPPPATSSPPTPSTPSSAPASTSTDGSSSNTSSKKWCIAWGFQGNLSAFDLPRVAAVYDWSPDKPDGLDQLGIPFMPMLWGFNQVQDFDNKVVPGYGNTLLGCNEPNEPLQSNMSPEQAMGLWMQHIVPHKQDGYTLVGPVVTGDAIGYEWIRQFMSLCGNTTGCIVDKVSYHAYTTNVSELISFGTDLHTEFGLPVYLTEFACQDFSGNNQQATMSQVWDFAGAVVEFVETNSWLEMACPFGALTDLQGVNEFNRLMDAATGNPTPLGYFYFQGN